MTMAMTNEQRAILAAWDKAVIVHRVNPGNYTPMYDDALMEFFESLRVNGTSFAPHYGPLAVGYGW